MSRVTKSARGQQEQPHGAAARTAHIAMLAAFFLVAGVLGELHLQSLTQTDVWWHLRTGLWVLQNHSVPHAGVFSQYPSLPWVDSNWGFDLMLADGFRWLGLAFFPLLAIAIRVLLAGAVFVLASGMRRFWTALLLAICAQLTFAFQQPQPAGCAACLFAILLAVLFQYRRSGNARLLLAVPLLFVLWASLDVTFVYGICVLLLFAAVGLVQERFRGGEQDGASRRGASTSWLAACCGSIVACMASPYHYHAWGAALHSMASGAYGYVGELHAIRFRQVQDYLLLLLVMCAFYLLGRRRSFISVALLAAALPVSLAIQRDRWVVVIVSVAVIADALANGRAKGNLNAPPGRMREALWAAAGVLAVLVGSGAYLLRDQDALLSRVAGQFPVRAADCLRSNHLPAPLFNEYQWGSFLTWYLPEFPVSIDSRVDLYGDETNLTYLAVMNGYISPDSDPSFARARTFLVRHGSSLEQAVLNQPWLRVVYRDEIATVAVRTE